MLMVACNNKTIISFVVLDSKVFTNRYLLHISAQTELSTFYSPNILLTLSAPLNPSALYSKR